MDDFEDLIRSVDRPRELHPGELERLRATLPNTEEVGQPSTAFVAEPFALEQPHPRNSRYGWLAAAAAVLIVVGVAIGLGTRGGEDPDSVAAIPEVTLSQIEQFCGDEVLELIDGLEEWRNIDFWALTVSGSPDLEGLTIDALLAMGDLDLVAADPERATAVAAAVDRVAPDLGPGKRADVRAAAVRDAVAEMAALLNEIDSAASCDVARLLAAGNE